MLASLSQAVYLFNAPLAQAARLAGALQAKAEQDPSILAGGAGSAGSRGDTRGRGTRRDRTEDASPAEEPPAEAEATESTEA